MIDLKLLDIIIGPKPAVNGWENPDYTYHVCPVCDLGGDDGEVSDYWNSILSLFDVARQDSEVIK